MRPHRNLFHALRAHAPTSPALTDARGTLTYGDLLRRAASLRGLLQLDTVSPVSAPPRVGIFMQPQRDFVAALLAAWLAPAIAVPLSPLYPPAALTPLLEDAAPCAVLSEGGTVDGLPRHTPTRVILAETAGEAGVDDREYVSLCDAFGGECARSAGDAGLLMFTSGTTGRAKGVVWRHAMVEYQTRTLSAAWRWTRADRAVNVLPLHHIHGLVNVVLTGLYSGAHVELHGRFEAGHVWEALLREEEAPSVVMGVPTVYGRLIEAYERAGAEMQQKMRAAAGKVRLFVCGSAGLAKRDFEKWERISGQRVLERYGMTETGMTLSNGYGERRQGMLGVPLDGVEARVRGGGAEGELVVRGDGVFREYWGRAEETRAAFEEGGWFRTGDVVKREDGAFRMVGRAGSGFVKTGGFKVAAAEVEEVVREVGGVRDCAVVGIADEDLGERLVAMVEGSGVVEQVQAMAAQRLPRYKRPRAVVEVDALPRNVMGKVTKQRVRELVEARERGGRESVGGADG